MKTKTTYQGLIEISVVTHTPDTFGKVKGLFVRIHTYRRNAISGQLVVTFSKYFVYPEGNKHDEGTYYLENGDLGHLDWHEVKEMGMQELRESLTRMDSLAAVRFVYYYSTVQVPEEHEIPYIFPPDWEEGWTWVYLTFAPPKASRFPVLGY